MATPVSMLTIKVISYKNVPVDQPITAEFREEGGTIGRSSDCTLLLPDPDRVISRTHAVVVHQEGRFVLRDQGTTVPVVVNGRPVGKGRDHPLAAGDEVRIAQYVMQVHGLRDQEIAADDTTTILRAGNTLLSWSEDGKPPLAENRISTFIVPSPDSEEPAPPPAAAPAVAAVATPPARIADASGDELLAALLRGAGVRDLAIPGGLTPQFMEDVGAVMRETMRGVLDLLAARASAKREVRADATVIVANDNNMLKFAPDLEAAITHLLMPRGQGFMSPQRSLIDARESLRSHQEGFLAGMRAALAAVLLRFDPAKLEERLTETPSGGSLLPMNHKAKLWNLYEALYGEISREAETDFHFLFGEEFLRAYQAKTRPAAPRDAAPDQG
ncbi:MAG: type VI secretion system-associated FHA domain protein TagH [Burkholderiales bacterium]|nr:type VI secretion system-associated FHA domain protein TagH [Burkholderiales bacterium]